MIDKKLYKLFINEKTFRLTISILENESENISDDEIKRINDSCYVSYNRRNLIELAKEIKDNWIKDREREINLIRNSEIRIKE